MDRCCATPAAGLRSGAGVAGIPDQPPRNAALKARPADLAALFETRRS